MKNSKIIYLFFALLSYAGCSDTRSMDAGAGAVAAPTLLGVERPSKDAIILSRDIEFKNNQNISYCEVLSTETKSYSGYRDQELYPLASLSKVITSAWALKKLGADYTFQTEWFAAPVSNQQDIFDVYLKTNYDPVFNIEKVLYFMSELRRHRILKIRTLTIDETTRVYLSALALPHLELGTVPVSTAETMQNLELALNSDHWSTQTANAKKKFAKLGVNNQ